MKINTLKKSPIFFGLALAVIVAIMEIFFNRIIPQAYEICTVCHARDLLSRIINVVVNLEMDSPDFARHAVVLTPIGLIAGAFIASKRNGEFKFLRVEKPVLMILYGFLVSTFGLFIMSCPTRIILRVAFGDTFGIIALVGLFIGITLAVLTIKRRV